MKSLGIVRKLDSLGRVVVPKEVRKINGWETGTPVEFFTEGRKVVLQSFLGEREKDEQVDRLEWIESEIADNEQLKREVKKVILYLKGENTNE